MEEYIDIENGELSCYNVANGIKLFFGNETDTAAMRLNYDQAKQLGQWLIQMSER